eukprot:scaffold25182_cov62-Phaeocystis_antarctica.AAC.7
MVTVGAMAVHRPRRHGTVTLSIETCAQAPLPGTTVASRPLNLAFLPVSPDSTTATSATGQQLGADSAATKAANAARSAGPRALNAALAASMGAPKVTE